MWCLKNDSKLIIIYLKLFILHEGFAQANPSNHEYLHVSQFVADPVQFRQLKSQNSHRIVVESFIPLKYYFKNSLSDLIHS